MEARNHILKGETKGIKVKLSEKTWWKSLVCFPYNFSPDYKNIMIIWGGGEEWKKVCYSLAVTASKPDVWGTGSFIMNWNETIQFVSCYILELV